ncbi:hypothetical protein J7I98_36895 [Streptomyces sp. ISL-98]|uniref:hypothetical protein n=1 Tax=Streptomyces sp. ISL-98 TaxID=2819192 RepID=UPI001BE68E8A|nr:hypothetical protein [Streptomyces sp. ISL-98]MBT2511302.1 hypothetical protein [Streptomyces sp. ISL-98]
MMLTITMGAAAWLLASVAVSGAVVRLILGVLAAYAARKALGPSTGSESADSLRAHRLAVLRALLNGLKSPGR